MVLDPKKHADWEIAQDAETRMKTVQQLGRDMGLLDKELLPYGHVMGKVDYRAVLERLGDKRNGKYVDNENVLFMGYGPYEDPEIAVCIIVEHGSSSPEVAAAAAEIFKAYYNYSGDTFTPSQSGELLP